MNQTRILIVDDNQDLADGLAVVLEDENHQVSVAYNGADGISAFDAGHFDIAFIDVKLPDMSGVEVFQYIHNSNAKMDAHCRTIMMTGYRVEQILADVIEKGDVKILRKPFEMKFVLDTLNQIKNESIVLIADDDKDFVDGMSEFLNEHGLKTIRAKNGKQAVEGVLSNPVDVLVLDLQMPIMSGLDVYLQLKQQGRAVKTIIVTGHEKHEAKTIDALRSMSVTGCLFKPFKPDEMLRAIEQVLLR